VRGDQVLPGHTSCSDRDLAPRHTPVPWGEHLSITHTGQIGQQIYKITGLITTSAMGHDFCRHAEHTSIHAKRAPELNISRVGLHTDGRWRPGWRDRCGCIRSRSVRPGGDRARRLTCPYC
jgi:hypothetical protein